MSGFDPGVQAYDPFDERAEFKLQYCIWPRRCYITGKLLFCTLAVHGRRTITGPGDPVYEDRWYHRDEHLIMLLQKA